ncbi:hypothetical protein [Peribacillus aracenensis]|uniref:hypothetical protein n=1 Tax=Peribacillus aracenensis TaxID=2976708 RepID=UPI0021A2FC6C|nr:hypothetical protein [Peribacillus sp. BBB004]
MSVVPCIVWTLFIFYIYKKLDKEDINAFLKKWSTPLSVEIMDPTAKIIVLEQEKKPLYDLEVRAV